MIKFSTSKIECKMQNNISWIFVVWFLIFNFCNIRYKFLIFAIRSHLWLRDLKYFDWDMILFENSFYLTVILLGKLGQTEMGNYLLFLENSVRTCMFHLRGYLFLRNFSWKEMLPLETSLKSILARQIF